MKFQKLKILITLSVILSSLVLNSFAQTTTTDLSKGVIGYYPFNGDTKNHCPNRIDGTDALVFGASESYDRNDEFNKAYTFDGIDDYIKIGKPLSLNHFSIGFWYNTNSASSGTILFWEDADFSLTISETPKDNGKLSFLFGKGDGKKNKYVSKTRTNEGTWHHFLLSFNGQQLTVYEDGKRVGAGIPSSGMKSQGLRKGSFFIGGYPEGGDAFYQGRIDELLVYNRALFSNEVETIFNSNEISFNEKLENGLIYHLPFGQFPLNQSENVMKGLEGGVSGATGSFDRFQEASDACHFDGIDDYIKLGKEAKHPMLSACFWMNTTTTANSQIMGWGDDAGFNVKINQEHQAGKLQVNLWVSGEEAYSFISPESINDGKWHFVAFAYDGTVVQGYLDGRKIYEDSKPGGFRPVNYNDTDLSLGNKGKQNFQGRLDDVRLFNRALSSSEISAIQNEDPRPSAVKIYTAFDQSHTLKIDFIKSFKGKIELLIYDRNGRLLEKKKHKVKGDFSYSLRKFNVDHFSVKVKVKGSEFEKEVVFCGA